MVDRVFLTETRRNVLAGDAEMAESTVRSHRSRIRSRARVALQELAEVAASEEVETGDVFDAADVEQLLRAVLSEPESITPFWDAFEDRDARREHQETYADEREVVAALRRVVNAYEPRLTWTTPPAARDDVELLENVDDG